jgi:hypothetical protein
VLRIRSNLREPTDCAIQLRTMGKTWRALGRKLGGSLFFRPQSKELKLRISPDNLSLDEPHLRIWTTELISLSDDGETLFATVGVEKPFSSGGVVQYFFGSIALTAGKVSLLAPLKDIRF